MNNTSALSPWQRVAALTVEGLYLLPALTLRAAEFIGVWQLTDPESASSLSPTDPLLWLAVGSWLLQAMFLPPLRLGRVAWYQQLATAGGIPPLRLLLAGFRRWGSAIRWRWQVWWRRGVVTLISALPTAVMWGLAHRLTGAGQVTAGLVWAGIGALLIPLAGIGVWLWNSRYATAPLLLLAGCPAGAVMGLSARAMAGHRREYVNLWGRCLPGFPFLLPRWRVRRIRWLHQRLAKADLSIFSSTAPVRGCILPPAPL